MNFFITFEQSLFMGLDLVKKASEPFPLQFCKVKICALELNLGNKR